MDARIRTSDADPIPLPSVGTDEDAYCELSFSPNVSLIGTVRRFVGEFYVKVLNNPSVTSRLVVATHELLENAVRYSSDGKSRIRIGVARMPDRFHVQIETTNRTRPANQDALVATLKELVSHGDRAKAYNALLIKSAKRDTGSGLGLGRIYAEAEMDLVSRMIDGQVVHLTANGSYSIDGGKAMGMITNIATPELSTETIVGSADLTVRMSGTAETNAMTEVDSFLRRLHERALTDKVRQVTVDLRSLDFMNSSCFKAFVSWIDRLQGTAPDARYNVKFIHDERKHWQSRSLGALAGFAVDLIKVETA
jgi:hypothetical protein